MLEVQNLNYYIINGEAWIQPRQLSLEISTLNRSRLTALHVKYSVPPKKKLLWTFKKIFKGF